MIRFTFTEDPPAVIAVECAVRGYPNRDANGRLQYDNSHFDTWEEAHATLVQSLEIATKWAVDSRAHMTAELGRVTRAVADFTAKLFAARELAEQRAREQRLDKAIKENAA